MTKSRLRRTLCLGTAAFMAAPASSAARRALTAMTEGPFYPPAAWRRDWADQDADLTRVVQRDGTRSTARGEHLGLDCVVADTQGRAIDQAEVEIWQCDVLAAYRHPRVRSGPGDFDPGFQGFGIARSDRAGQVRLRTIRPVAYPGRTPHIHVTLRHASFGSLTTQLFVAGDAGNARDFLWRSLAADERAALEMTLVPAADDSGLRWQARQPLVVPA